MYDLVLDTFSCSECWFEFDMRCESLDCQICKSAFYRSRHTHFIYRKEQRCESYFFIGILQEIGNRDD